MPENIDQNNKLELEIADLSRQIERKRKELEKEQGVISPEVDDKEVLRQALTEKQRSIEIEEDQNTKEQESEERDFESQGGFRGMDFTGVSYWDNLDEAVKNEVENLVNLMFRKNLDQVFRAARKVNRPIVIDAFHDVLVEVLYQELKDRGLIK